MAVKQFKLQSVGEVKVYKRRGARSIRLSVTPGGQTRCTIPAWLPYQAALKFVTKNVDWLAQHRQAPKHLRPGQPLGKAHHLEFRATAARRPSARLQSQAVIVSYPANLAATDGEVQAAALRGSLRALKLQAEHLLPARVEALAQAHGFNYESVRVKHLTSRWGSCDTHGNIVLNLYLMQLPWTLIDYVILHELTHTRVLRHGAPFWQAMQRADERSRTHRQALKGYRPAIMP